VFAVQERGRCEQLSQEDGEYVVVVVDDDNASILADPEAHSNGPPSHKVGRNPVVC
jgi:hypothetical protein